VAVEDALVVFPHEIARPTVRVLEGRESMSRRI
jgi:hypothetical protein